MKRLTNLTIAGIVTDVSNDTVTINAHGNIIKLNAASFKEKIVVNQTVWMEINIYEAKRAEKY